MVRAPAGPEGKPPMKIHAPRLAAAALTVFLLTGCEPDTVWSPDSKRLALDPHGMLVTYDVAANKFQQRTFGPTQALNPTWTPDGKSVLYYNATVNKQGEVQALKLASLDLATGKISALPTAVAAPKVVEDPNAFRIDLGGRMDVAREVLTTAYSPDGSKLAYVSFNGTKTEIWLADAAGNGSKRVVSLGTAAFRPVWSPDGERLAYFTESAEEPKPNPEPPAEGAIQPTRKAHRLEVVNADGSGAKVLWPETRPDILAALGPRPEWAADSKSLMLATDNPPPMGDPQAFGGGPSQTGKLWSVPLEGEPKVLGELPGPTLFSHFSGGRVAFFKAPKDMNEKDPRLTILAPPYDAAKEILQIPPAMVGVKPGQQPEVDAFPVPTLSPDGKTVALLFAQKSGPVKLVLFPTNGDKPSSLDVPLKLPTALVKPKAPAKKPVKPAAKAKPKR